MLLQEQYVQMGRKLLQYHAEQSCFTGQIHMPELMCIPVLVKPGSKVHIPVLQPNAMLENSTSSWTHGLLALSNFLTWAAASVRPGIWRRPRPARR